MSEDKPPPDSKLDAPGPSGDGHHKRSRSSSKSKSSTRSKTSPSGKSQRSISSTASTNSDGTLKQLDLEQLIEYLTDCIKSDSTISLEHYIKMYKELNKFFECLGYVFTFVAKDVGAKILILDEYLKSKEGVHYQTVQSMVKYETENNLLRKETEPLSGARTLLRLHRALEFVIEFLTLVHSSQDDDLMGPHAQESYNNTIAPHHSWILRQTVTVAATQLPNKKQLLEQSCKVSEKKSWGHLISVVITKGREVYDAVQALYKKNKILDLP